MKARSRDTGAEVVAVRMVGPFCDAGGLEHPAGTWVVMSRRARLFLDEERFRALYCYEGTQ